MIIDTHAESLAFEMHKGIVTMILSNTAKFFSDSLARYYKHEWLKATRILSSRGSLSRSKF